MKEFIGLWEDEIGKERTVRLVERVYHEKALNDFDEYLKFKGNTSLIKSIEQVGNVISEAEFLVVHEKKALVNLFAQSLISKSLSPEFKKALNDVLIKEFDQDNWLEEEIKEIKSLLDELNRDKELE